MFDGLLWAASLLVSCNLVSGEVINIAPGKSDPLYQRECRYICQDKSVEVQNTNREYYCPKNLSVNRPVDNQKNTYKRDINPNLYIPKTPWYRNNE